MEKKDMHQVCTLYARFAENPVPPCVYPAAQLWFVQSGKGTIKLSGQKYGLRSGTAVSVLPWQVWEIPEVKEPVYYYSLTYDFEQMNSSLKAFRTEEGQPLCMADELEKCPAVSCTKEQAEELRAVWEQIRREIGISSVSEPRFPPDSFHFHYLISKLSELLILHCRFGKDMAYGSRKPSSMLQSDFFYYIYTNLGKNLSLFRLARLFDMSEDEAGYYIRKMTGMNFFDLLNEMRIGKTMNFLAYTDLTMKELSELLGFSDSAHISKVFLAKTGMKAGEYRQTYRNVGALCGIRGKPDAYKVVEYLYRNCAEPLTSQSVAEHFHISSRELNDILLWQVEKNFTEFLNYLRINRACVMLKTTRYTIMDIAVEVGYNNLKTFNRNFLRFRGMTAGEFRKKVRLEDIF